MMVVYQVEGPAKEREGPKPNQNVPNRTVLNRNRSSPPDISSTSKHFLRSGKVRREIRVSDDLSPLAEFLLVRRRPLCPAVPPQLLLVTAYPPPAYLDMSVENFLPRQKPLATETTWNKPFAMAEGCKKEELEEQEELEELKGARECH